MYDSRPPARSSSEDKKEDEESHVEGVFVFAIRENLEMLCGRPKSFLDGIFKVACSTFAQVFTILIAYKDWWG